MKSAQNTVVRKELFHLPKGLIYLDGNSLGPLVKSVEPRIKKMLNEEWGDRLIWGWNDSDWIELPMKLGNQIAKLIGAPKDSVVTGDTLSIKVYQALAASLHLNPNKKIILSDSGNFPTDLYMAQGLIDFLADGYQLKVVEPHEVENSIDESIAVMMITEVDYRTGRKHDVNQLIKKAKQNGALTIIDLAHSAGAIEVNVVKSNCDFAVGCTYKYLNGGPGAPAFIYVKKDLIEKTKPVLAGWMGHQAPFAFDLDYSPAMSIERLKVGTPAIIQMTALQESMKVWKGVKMSDVRKKSMELTDLFIKEVESRTSNLKLISPRDATQRGSQVSFVFNRGYEAMQALIDHNVIGDFRAPDVMRFGFTPLYIDEGDVIEAARVIEKVIQNKLYDKAKYKKANKVT